MRTIVVTDPYFGTWLTVSLGGYWATQGYALGPLAQRTIRDEQLRNYGTVVRAKDGTCEKNCTHHWVQGSITGTVTPPAGLRILSMTSTGFTAESLQTYTRTYWTVNQYISVASSGLMTITVEGTYQQYTKANSSAPWVLRKDVSGSMVYTLTGTVDEYTGAVVWHSPVLVRRTGACTNGTITTRSCPYGTAGDYIGPALQDVQYWIQATYNLARDKTELDRHLRASAVMDGLDNTELAELNWLEMAKDASEPLGLLERLGTFTRATSSWRAAIKAAGSLHLMWEYFVKTGIMTWKEVRKLRKALRRGFRRQTLFDKDLIGHGTASKEVSGDGYSGEDTYTAKVVLAPGFGPFGTVQQLQSLGLLPKASDVWDLIPYSFVVDWIYPVQRTISQLEGASALMQCPLRYIVSGRKLTLHFAKTWTTPTGHTFLVDITHVSYERWVKFTIPLDLSASFRFRDPRKHSVTALALVSQVTL